MVLNPLPAAFKRGETGPAFCHDDRNQHTEKRQGDPRNIALFDPLLTIDQYNDGSRLGDPTNRASSPCCRQYAYSYRSTISTSTYGFELLLTRAARDVALTEAVVDLWRQIPGGPSADTIRSLLADPTLEQRQRDLLRTLLPKR